MSWSIGFIGTTQKVVEALKAESEKLSGVSKNEFDAALPHLIGLVEQNMNDTGQACVKLEANGHGTFSNGKQTSGNLTMSLQRFYGEILA